MKYVGIQTQQNRNNMMSIFLLVMFPVILLGMVWVFLALMAYFNGGYNDQYGNYVTSVNFDAVNQYFLSSLPWVVGGVCVWFLIAYFSNTAMVRAATGARPLERRENPRLYNIVENLVISSGMDMPKINVINDPQLNAFASGIDRNSYTVTVTTGLLQVLDDAELEGVIAHELTHIRNRDTRLLITSIIFVGIISTVMSLVYNMVSHMLWFGGTTSTRSNDDEREGNGAASAILVFIVALICCAIAYLFTVLTRFAISRKREFMADAGGAQMCGNSLALASALRKISGNPGLGATKRDDVAQLFIVRPKMSLSGVSKFMSSLFATHPDTAERIRILEQF